MVKTNQHFLHKRSTISVPSDQVQQCAYNLTELIDTTSNCCGQVNKEHKCELSASSVMGDALTTRVLFCYLFDGSTFTHELSFELQGGQLNLYASQLDYELQKTRAVDKLLLCFRKKHLSFRYSHRKGEVTKF